MNALLAEVRRSLHELASALAGDLTMSPPLEALGAVLGGGRVPPAWAALGTPSLRGLAAWVANVLRCHTQLAEWTADLEASAILGAAVPALLCAAFTPSLPAHRLPNATPTNAPVAIHPPIHPAPLTPPPPTALPCLPPRPQVPRSVWLPGLFNPQAFLTAVMQTAARRNDWPLDRTALVTEATRRPGPEAVDAPSREGAYIHGAHPASQLVALGSRLAHTEHKSCTLEDCRLEHNDAEI